MARRERRIFTDEEKQYIMDNFDKVSVRTLVRKFKTSNAVIYDLVGRKKADKTYKPTNAHIQFVLANPTMTKRCISRELEISIRKVDKLVAHIEKNTPKRKAIPEEVYYDYAWTKRARERCEAIQAANQRSKRSRIG